MDPGVNARRPIFVAIGGDSGSGKSTLTAGFYRIFPASRISSLCLDDYHSLDRRERGLVGEIVSRLEQKGLKLVAAELRTAKQIDWTRQRPAQVTARSRGRRHVDRNTPFSNIRAERQF